MINLNDYKQEEKEVKIFNNGQAGRVKNVKVEITKKKPEDNPNSPDFKVNYIDSTGAMINDAIYYPKDSDTDRQKQINMSRIISLLHSISPDTKDKMLPEFDNYVAAVDFLVKQIAAASKNSTVNVFAAYGTKNNPQQYLRVRKFNFVEPANADDSTTRLVPKVASGGGNPDWDDVMERVTPTSFDNSSDFENSSSDNDDDTLDW